MKIQIGFIGGGNMAEAIIKGLRTAGVDVNIAVTNRSNRPRLERLVESYGVQATNLEDLVTQSDIILIAVKPKDVIPLLKDLRDYPLGSKLIITVAAGIPLSTYEEYLAEKAIIRAMPNTSTAVLHSMTGLVKGSYVTSEEVQAAEDIFKAIGSVIWIPEEKMNALIAVSGSGPAYYYLFTECLIQAGIELGLATEEAEQLARETVIGVGKMIAESGKPPARLREEVTSPNGTTYAALKAFGESDLKGIVLKAAKACAKRAEEMEGEYAG